MPIKGALQGLRQFLISESPLKMMKNAFSFILKVLFVLKIINFLLWLFGHVEKTTWLERQGSFQNWETIPRPLSKKSRLSISLEE